MPLSVMVTEADRAPLRVGLKVTVMVQAELIASVAGLNGQVLLCAKSPGLAPVSRIEEMVRRPGPALVRVTL